MPTINGYDYKVEGKTLVWTPEPWDDEPTPAEIRLPLKVKVANLTAFTELDGDDAPSAQRILEFCTTLFPKQMDAIRELDGIELATMFFTWSREFGMRSGFSLGEALPSPDGSTGIGDPSSTSSDASE